MTSTTAEHLTNNNLFHCFGRQTGAFQNFSNDSGRQMRGLHIGKRTAETIAVTLKGKVDRFLDALPAGATPGEGGSTTTPAGGLARDALHVLLQLGENRMQAINWIDRAMSSDDAPKDAEALVAEVYRIKGGG